MECEICEVTKDIKEFPKRRKDSPIKGIVCRKCSKDIYKKNYYSRNLGICLERSRKQKEDDPEGYRQYLRNYYKENKEELRQKSNAYRRNNLEQSNARSRKYRSTPEGSMKEKARGKVNSAIRLGKIIKPITCEDCKQEREIQAHHEDYSRPLDVQWLCKECHWKRHSM